MKMRARTIVVITGTLLLTLLMLLPQITEAGGFNWFISKETPLVNQEPTSSPGQAGLGVEHRAYIPDVGSYHNDTTLPIPNIKTPPPLPHNENTNEKPQDSNKHKNT